MFPSRPLETLFVPAAGASPTLTKRVRSAIGWTASSSLLSQLIGFCRSIVIAWILAPADFGLFSIAFTVVLGLNALTTIGLDQTILAHQFATEKELREHLNTVWSAELLRGFFLTVLLLALAYPTARFYGQPKLLILIPVLSLASLIEGFQNTGLVLLRKQISFARLFWFQVTSKATAAILTITLAVVMRNVWALVLGQLILALLSTSLSYLFHPYRPRFAFEKVAIGRALIFGKFALVIAVASYVTTMADNVAVGRMLGMAAVGSYVLAYNLASFPIEVLVFALGKATLPAFAELAASGPGKLVLSPGKTPAQQIPNGGDHLSAGRLDHAFTRVFAISSLVLISLTVPLFLLSRDVVQLLYGEKWAAAAPALQILSLVIPLRGLVLIINSLFYGVNRPKPVAIGKTLEAAVFLLLIYPLTSTFGLTGAAWTAVSAYGFGLAHRMLVLNSVIPGLSKKLIRLSISAIAATGAGLLIGASILGWLDPVLPRIVLGGLLATAIPAMLLVLMRPDLRKWITETTQV